MKKIEKLKSFPKPKKGAKAFDFLPIELPPGLGALADKAAAGADVPEQVPNVATLDEKLALCPTDPGIYLMKDVAGHVIYIGKAKNLRARVRSYFQDQGAHDVKTLHLVSKIASFDLLTTSSETEALILENEFIKKFKPKYNLRLKDDKTYPFIKIDLKHPFPRAYIARRQVSDDGNEYLGPFPISGQLRLALTTAAKLFQIRDCRDHEFSNRSRPCISFEMGTCTAPCVGAVTKEQYALQIQGFKSFLKGEDQTQLLPQWEGEMQEAAEQMDFEKAARLRDRITALKTLHSLDQRIVSGETMLDQDVWALWPSEASDLGEAELLVSVILQIRRGKLVGSVARSADLREIVEREDLLVHMLFQHYARHPLPAELVLPQGHGIDKIRAELGGALGELGKQFSQKLAKAAAAPLDAESSPSETEPSLTIRLADENETLIRISQMACDNARSQFEEVTKLQARKSDALKAIADLVGLEVPPRRLECIDVSNLQGEANVASCVVFLNAQPEKTEYRHYKIQGFEGQNDFASMKEVIFRRYAKPDSPVPDLLVIDGGRGQVAAVCEILKELQLKFAVVGLAKARVLSDFKSGEVESSEERLFLPNQKNYIRIRNAEALKVLTHLRDEAHRFAIEFHRKKRSENRGLS